MTSTSTEKKADPTTTTERDYFDDLEKLKVKQNFTEIAGVLKKQTMVKVDKPAKQAFIKTHPDREFSIAVNLLKYEETGSYYLVLPEVAASLEGEAKKFLLVPYISRQTDEVSLWPIQLSDEEGEMNSWHACSHEAADLARTQWTRIYFKSLAQKGYEVLVAKRDFPDPVWPEFSLKDLLRMAFKDRTIADFDHIVLKKLRGEV